MKLPRIPDSKKWNGLTTPEQDALMKIEKGLTPSKKDIEVLDCAFHFYYEAFNALKRIDLSKVDHNGANNLKDYLRDVINLELIVQNELTNLAAYRMIWVEDFNLDNRKVRDPKFLSHPPLDFIKKREKLGRANTSESVCLYLAETSQIAVLECKPSPGDRIIISGWRTKSNIPLIIYPITSRFQLNLNVKKANCVFSQFLDSCNFYFARLFNVIQSFISSEFTKNIPVTSEFGYEYLFSAYFAEKVLKSKILTKQNENTSQIGEYDGILYPSIAAKRGLNNIAVRESSVPKLNTEFCYEYIVYSANYELFDSKSDHLPFEGELIRKSIHIDDKIIWDDD